MSDLAFDSEEKALKNGYWPNKMGIDVMQDVAYNQLQCHKWSDDKLSTIWRDCEQEAIQEVEVGIADGLMPEQFRE